MNCAIAVFFVSWFLYLNPALPYLRLATPSRLTKHRSRIQPSSNHSLYFNGNKSGSIVIIPFSSIENSYQKTRALTFEVWLKPLRADSGGAILNKSTGICKDNWSLGYANLTPDFGTGNSCTGNEQFVEKRGSLVLGVWQHIAGVWDGDSIRLFVNGVQVAIKPYNGNPTADDIPMSIGANNHWNGDYTGLRGLVDEVRYSNVARYKKDFRPESRLESDTSTIFLFHFDEGFGTTLHDDSYNKLDAIARDATWSTDTPENHRGEYAPDSNTVCLLHLNETGGVAAFDASKHHNDGLVWGASVSGGKFAMARRFDKRNEHISIRDNSSLDFTRADEFTAECWLKVGAYPSDREITLIGKKDTSDAERYEWLVDLLPSGVVMFAIKGSSSGRIEPSKIFTSHPLTLNTWIHLAASWYGKTRTQVIQVNGVLEGSSSTGMETLHHLSAPVLICYGKESKYFDITVDELRLSNKALSSSAFNLPLFPYGVSVKAEENVMKLSWKNRGGPTVGILCSKIYRGVDSTALSFMSSAYDETFIDSTIVPGKTFFYSVSTVDSSEFETPRSMIVSAFAKGGGFLSVLDIIAIVLVAGTMFVFVGRRRFGSWRHKQRKALPEEVAKLHEEQITNASIGLFGQLQIVDSDGRDRTDEIPPKLLQLFLLVLLHTNQDSSAKGGIRTEQLTSILWPEFSNESGKNSRGVAIKKLREVLASIGNIRIEIEAGRWFITLDKNVQCDYFEFMTLTKQLKSQQKISGPNNEFARWLDIVDKGTILPETSHEWLDPIKAAISEEAIDLCLKCIRDPDTQGDSSRIVKLADALLKWDSLSEEALWHKLHALSSVRRHGIIKTTFDSFTAEYKRTFEKDFPLSLEQFLSRHHSATM